MWAPGEAMWDITLGLGVNSVERLAQSPIPCKENIQSTTSRLKYQIRSPVLALNWGISMLQPSNQTQNGRVKEKMKSQNTLQPTSYKPHPSPRPRAHWEEEFGILQKIGGDQK